MTPSLTQLHVIHCTMPTGHEQKWNPKPLFLPKRVEERLYFYENKAEWGKSQKYKTINVRTKLTTFITCLASLLGLFVGKAAEKKDKWKIIVIPKQCIFTKSQRDLRCKSMN